MKQALLFIIGVITSVNLSAADYYWVGGTGNWTDFSTHWATASGGSTFHTVAPTSADDVYFDANSFSSASTVTISATGATCKDMDWTGATNNPQFNSNSSGYTLTIYGDLTTTTSMTWPGSHQVHFKGGGNKSIDTKAVDINGYLYFDELGGNWTLNSELVADNEYLYLLSGTLNLNDETVRVEYLNINSSNSRTLNCASSDIYVNRYCYFQTITNFTLNAGTSTFYVKDHLFSNTLTFNDIVFDVTNTNVNFSGNNTVNRVTKKGTGSIYVNQNNTIGDLDIQVGVCSLMANNTISDSLIMGEGTTLRIATGVTQTVKYLTGNGGCGNINTIESTSQGGQAGISKSSGTVDLKYYSIRDIAAIGGATFNADSSFDVSGNTGWSFTTLNAKTYYWIGGTGNWSDGSHWSLTSGGAAASCGPSSIDDVIFDANSFSSGSNVLTIDALNASCKDMTWTGVTDNPQIAGSGGATLNIHGSLMLDPNMTWNYSGNTWFKGTSNHTITTNGVIINCQWYFDEDQGSWTLGDDLNMPSRYIYHYRGDFNTGNYDMNLQGFNSDNSNSRTVTLGSSVITTRYWYMNNTNNLTFSAGTSEIFITGSQFTGGNATYNFVDVTYTGTCSFSGTSTFKRVNHNGTGQLNINNSSTFDTLRVNAGAVYLVDSNTFSNVELAKGVTVMMGASRTQNVDNWIGDGDCTNYITIKSSSSGTAATLKKTSGTLALDFYQVEDITATGGATFQANNSYDNGGNTGWTIQSNGAVDYYWVGGSGNWSDGNHWATSSGGSGSGCGPTVNDNIFFDANSFSSGSATVNVDILNIGCKNMDWTGAGFSPVFQGSIGGSFTVMGDMTLNPNMTWNYYYQTYFRGSDTNYIDPAGIFQVNGDFYFDDVDGTWILEDDLNMYNRTIQLYKGTFMTNDYDLTINQFTSDNADIRTLDFGNSNIYLRYRLDIDNNTNFTYKGSNAKLTFDGGNGYLYANTGGYNFGNVEFSNTSSCQINGNNTFKTITMNCPNQLSISGNQGIDVLDIRDGTTYLSGANTITKRMVIHDDVIVILASNQTQTVANLGGVPGTMGSQIYATSPGTQATLQQTSGTVCLENVTITDINATGGATFSAGLGSVDNGNNTGWTFGSTACLLPDLNVLSIETAANATCAGETLTYTVNIKNEGALASGPFSIGVYENSSSCGGALSFYVVEAVGIDPDSTTSYDVDITYPDEGIANISFVADAQHDVADFNLENNCGVSSGIEIHAAIEANVQIVNEINCNGFKTGAAFVSAFGGSGQYDFVWSNAGMTQSISGVGAGLYHVTLSDKNYACEHVDSVEFVEPDSLMISMATTDATSGNNGSAVASVSGGTMPYTYNWSTGDTIDSLTGLAKGVYVLTVIDANFCTQTEIAYVDGGTGIDGKRNALKIYPIPADKTFVFDAPSSGTIEVIDLTGKLVIRLEVEHRASSIDVSEIPSGLYQLRFISESTALSRSILIQH